MNLNRFLAMDGPPVKTCSTVWIKQTDADFQKKLFQTFGSTLPETGDGFALEITENQILVHAPGSRGYGYGCSAAEELAEQKKLRQGIVMAVPRSDFRGVKLYLPDPDQLECFYRTVDDACRLRYNTVILELGGAMEYRSHPEINEGWLEYAEQMNKASGYTIQVQNSFKWAKNSIHTQNGGGKVLSQEILREMAAYCRKKQIALIPEVPSLSHCDYLLTRHPELAERSEDPYPDTYCPSNPKSYELLFDLLDEIVSVFSPDLVHIGHDECYSIGNCPMCKGKSAAQLYAQDIIRIHDYLAEKNIAVMIWAEKLLNAHDKNGYPLGGSLHTYGEKGWDKETVPATFEAIDLIPRDVRLMHWYWNIDRHYETEFLRRGFSVVYGNLSCAELPQAEKRLESGIAGGAVSNWGSLEPDYLRRNGILFDLHYNAALFWGQPEEYEELSRQVFADCFAEKQQAVLQKNHIRVRHRAVSSRRFVYFFDGIMVDEEADILGWYEITASGKRTARLPVFLPVKRAFFPKNT